MLDADVYSSPVPTADKAELAERALRSAIVTCALSPGERLSETSLAREFGLGRGSVRAALARLQSAGFVSSSARSGWQVTPVSAGEIRELGAARRHLEPLLCSAVLDERDLARLDTLAQMHAALMHRRELDGGMDVVSSVRRCEREILECLSARLAMPIVSRWLTDLWDRSIRLVHFFEARGPVKFVPANRSRLVEALASGRRYDALEHLAAANSALETYLLDRFLASGAVIAAKAPRRSVPPEASSRSLRSPSSVPKVRTL